MEKELLSLVSDFLNIENCNLETKRSDIENWDSLAHVMLLSEIENKFDKKIKIEDFASVTSVKDILDLLQK